MCNTLQGASLLPKVTPSKWQGWLGSEPQELNLGRAAEKEGEVAEVQGSGGAEAKGWEEQEWGWSDPRPG